MSCAVDLESDLESIARELYGLPPGEFVAARTAAEKQAKAAGDRDLAAHVHRLAKPTAAAWVANQLVRRHPDEIAALRELGAGLREATATLHGEQLRRLSQQQNRVVHALVEQARRLASAAGQPLSEATERGLDATLRAALADEQLADALATGQLTTALEHVGFSETVGSGAAFRAAPAPREPVREAPREDPAERRRREQLDRARSELRAARTAERETKAALDRADAALARADSTLAEATAAFHDAEHRQHDAAATRAGAGDAAHAAAERLSHAQDALERLSR
jgi:hypothetical protein